MNSISISGYKSFKTVELKLNPINILIGANGSGKSNFLSFFEMLHCIYEKRLTEYVALNGGTERFFHKGHKVTDVIKATVAFQENSYELELKEGDGRLVFAYESLGQSSDGTMLNLSSASYKPESDMLNNSLYGQDENINAYLKSISKYHFHDTGKQSPFTRESNVKSDIFTLYEDGRNLAAFLYGIRAEHPMTYKRIVKVIQSIAPYFLDFYLEPNSNDYVRLLWKDKYSDTIYSPSALSDGTLRFIALTTLFLQPNPSKVIVIDEPELGLHPQAIGKLTGLIKSVSQRGVQVIVATQSADLISAFTPEDVITVNQVNGETHFERLESEKLSRWLEEYTLGDLWKSNIIQGGQPR